MTITTFTSSVITDSADPIFSYAADGDGLIVNAGVTLANRGDFAVEGRGWNGLRDLTAAIDGTLRAPGWNALDAYSSSIAVTVGSTGRLESVGAMAMEVSYDSSLVNHGTLYAARGFGAVFTDVTDASVENWGSIFGEVGALSLSARGAPGSTARVVNHGALEAGGGADDWVSGAGTNQAIYASVDTTSIVNTGSILAADKVGTAITVQGLTATIENSGSIESARYWGIVAQGTTAVDITNSGTIAGAAGSLWLTQATDTLNNDGHLDGRVVLGGGNDVYHGEGGWVTGAVWGQSGDDLLVGGARADILGGGNGNDTLTGGAGNDVLTGAGGADVISGGAGDDVFRFALTSDAVGDTIVSSGGTAGGTAGGAAAFEGAGIAGGDRIDLSAIDANTGLGGQQHFSFGSTQAIGDLWAVDVDGVTHIRGNTAGGALPEFDLAILDGDGVQASDYAAIDFIL